MNHPPVRKLKFIGCEILYREACYLAATSRNTVDVEFMRKGLHDLETADMVAKLQATIDAVDASAGYEAILLGYARCNDGVVGLRARSIPLVIPRAHDCITLFMGSRRAFQEYFDRCPGTFYMTTGWAERDRFAEDGYAQPAYGQTGVMGKLGLAEPYEQMVEKYGKENADFIVESLGGWTKHYSRYLYIEMGKWDESAWIDWTRRQADERGWQFERCRGDWNLLAKLFDGPWDEDFVVVPPGGQLVARNDSEVLAARAP